MQPSGLRLRCSTGRSVVHGSKVAIPAHIYMLTIANPTNVAALVLFAVLVSNLAAQVRGQALTAQARARTTESLYALSRKLAGASNLDDVLWVTAYQIAAQLDVQVVVLLPDAGEGIAVRAGYPPEDTLDAAAIPLRRRRAARLRP
jgi:two-component system, OmpR family, sensor histidine kinase KdpD